MPRAKSQTVFPILCRRTASLPGRPPRPNGFLAPCQRRRGALPRARRSKPAERRATSRTPCASLLSCGLRRWGPHYCAAPQRPRMPVPLAKLRKPLSRFCRRNASLPGHPPWPQVALACRQRRRGALPRAQRSKPATFRATARASRASLRSCGLRRCGPHSCAALRRPRMPVPLAQFADRFTDSLPASRFIAPPPAVAPRLPPPPSPVASRGAASRAAL